VIDLGTDSPTSYGPSTNTNSNESDFMEAMRSKIVEEVKGQVSILATIKFVEWCLMNEWFLSVFITKRKK